MDGRSNDGLDRNHVKKRHDWYTYTGDGRWPTHLQRKDHRLLNQWKRRKRKQKVKDDLNER